MPLLLATSLPPAEVLLAALHDPRVAQALHLAARDALLRARFEALRAEGLSVSETVEQLLGPHYDAAGQPYYLSDERVRAIVYRKERSR
ncbi:MAG: hypothetical protein AAFV01_13645 [Bacteroidota bacterium]